MQGYRLFLYAAAATTLSLVATGSASAATMGSALLQGAITEHTRSNVEQVARRCRYDRRGRLRCRGARYRAYRRYYYNPYAYYDYGYYPRFYGFGHHHHHSFGHGHHHGHH